MLRTELQFSRPAALQAVAPPEAQGRARDDVRLLVSTPGGAHRHARFHDLPALLQRGDLLVVNDSATLAASLPARAAHGPFRLNLSTDYGRGLWLAEPRRDHATPGPLPFEAGETIDVAGSPARMVAPLPGQPRLWFVRLEAGAQPLMQAAGEPIRYGYVAQPWPLAAYQTLFARVPGSAEMPSAARPFTRRMLAALHARGVGIASITLHTGVSSLEVESETVEQHVLYAEPFVVPAATAARIGVAQAAGRRVIAVGTTVVRALESAWDGARVRAAQGFTRLYITPERGVHAADGLLSGFHDPLASHLALLYAVAGVERIRAAYTEAVAHGYLWHEFGDIHLILNKGERPNAKAPRLQRAHREGKGQNGQGQEMVAAA